MGKQADGSWIMKDFNPYLNPDEAKYRENMAKHNGSVITKEQVDNDKDFEVIETYKYSIGGVAYKLGNYWWAFNFKKNEPAFLRVITIDPVLEKYYNHMPPFTGLIYTYEDLIKLCQILKLK